MKPYPGQTEKRNGTFVLTQELKAWSRIVDADDDPLDIADRMEELSGSVYTRYTEMLISLLLCDGELVGGMN